MTQSPEAPWQRPLKLIMLMPVLFIGAILTAGWYYSDLLVPVNQNTVCSIERYGYCSDPKLAFATDFTEMQLTTRDKKAVSAWWIPVANPQEQKENKSVLVVHGLGETKKQGLRLIPFFHKAGYSVLLFDVRGHGESSPADFAFGTDSCNDYRSAFGYLKLTQNQTKIWHYGFGFGSKLILECHDPEDKVAFGAILDSLIPDHRIWLDLRIAQSSNLPAKLVSFVAHLFSDLRFTDQSPGVEAALKNETKLQRLFLHGNKNEVLPIRYAQDFFERTSAPKKWTTVVGGRHATIWERQSAQIQKVVLNILTSDPQ